MDKVVVRLERVINELYAGNRAVLSRECGVDKSLLSKYLNGVLRPGRRVLEKIARPKYISVDWLSGSGDEAIEYSERPKDVEVLAHSRPVFDFPVKEVPDWSAMGAFRRAREVQPFFEKLNVYWVSVTEKIDGKEKLCFLLVEACEARSAVKADVGKRCVLERSGNLEFKVVGESDLNSKNKIYGVCQMGQWDE